MKKSIKIYKFAIISIFFNSTISIAWDADQKTELQPSIYYREIPQNGFSSKKSSYDFFFRAGHLLSLTNESWKFELKPEIYGFSGESRSESDRISNDPYYYSLKTPNRFFKLRKKLSLEDEWFLELDKIYFTFSKDELEISVGRRPISLGVLKIFPVWNKFSKPLPVTIGPQTTLSSDAITFRLQKESISYFLNSVKESTKDEDINFLGFTYYYSDLELHFLSGRLWNQNTIGIALAKDWLGASWRMESLLYKKNTSLSLNQSNKNQNESQFGFGVEYAFSERVSAVFEYLFQTEGVTNKEKYLTQEVNHFKILKARSYTYTQLQYKWSALINLGLGALINGIDGSRYDIIKIQYSYSDNSDLFAELNHPSGNNGAEFSKKSVILPNGMYMGAPTQIAMGFKYVF